MPSHGSPDNLTDDNNKGKPGSLPSPSSPSFPFSKTHPGAYPTTCETPNFHSPANFSVFAASFPKSPVTFPTFYAFLYPPLIPGCPQSPRPPRRSPVGLTPRHPEPHPYSTWCPPFQLRSSSSSRGYKDPFPPQPARQCAAPTTPAVGTAQQLREEGRS